MIVNRIFLAIALITGASGSPIRDELLDLILARAVPVPNLIEHDLGRLYTGKESHTGQISKTDLNSKSEEFYHKVADARRNNPQTADKPEDFLVAAHKHQDSIYYSSTMSVKPPGRGLTQPEAFSETAEKANEELKNKPKGEVPQEQKKLQGQIKSGQTSFAHRTQPPATVDADPRKNFAKCAEAGTCRQVEADHGHDVDMKGDKVSAYGKHGVAGTPQQQIGHVEACTSGNHKQFNCNGVGQTKELDDVNRAGRPDSSLGTHSPKPLTPVQTTTSPAEEHGSTSHPQSPKTPQKHYELPTISSSLKARPRHSRRALMRRAYLAAEIADLLEELSY